MAVHDRKRGTGWPRPNTCCSPGPRLQCHQFRAPANQAFKKPGKVRRIPLAADDPDAMKIAEQLVRDAGFDPVAVGPLARARSST